MVGFTFLSSKHHFFYLENGTHSHYLLFCVCFNRAPDQSCRSLQLISHIYEKTWLFQILLAPPPTGFIYFQPPKECVDFHRFLWFWRGKKRCQQSGVKRKFWSNQFSAFTLRCFVKAKKTTAMKGKMPCCHWNL